MESDKVLFSMGLSLLKFKVKVMGNNKIVKLCSTNIGGNIGYLILPPKLFRGKKSYSLKMKDGDRVTNHPNTAIFFKIN